MRPFHPPGLRSWNYVSTAQSPWHVWLEELGYPQLDVTRYEDGEWCLIEYVHAPLFPCECKYKVVLSGLKNIEISYSFIERYLDEINPMSQRFWANLEKHEQAQDAEWDTNEKNAEDRVNRAYKYVRQNPALMERIAKHGIQELDLVKIRKNIPNHKF